MGIINITPDSFSDGGQCLSAHDILKRLQTLQQQGAHIIDVGAESTRPGASPVTQELEWQRLAPLLEAYQALEKKTILSIDTRHSEMASRILEHIPSAWINDVSGGQDPAMLECIKAYQAPYIVMHHCGIPADPAKTLPEGTNMVAYLSHWAEEKMADFSKKGINPNQIIFDPGIGFGKTAEQSWQIIRGIGAIKKKVGSNWLVGHSRKSFLATHPAVQAQERDIETCLVSAYLATQGVDFIRVHHVLAHQRALNIGQKLYG